MQLHICCYLINRTPMLKTVKTDSFCNVLQRVATISDPKRGNERHSGSNNAADSRPSCHRLAHPATLPLPRTGSTAADLCPSAIGCALAFAGPRPRLELKKRWAPCGALRLQIHSFQEGRRGPIQRFMKRPDCLVLKRNAHAKPNPQRASIGRPLPSGTWPLRPPPREPSVLEYWVRMSVAPFSHVPPVLDSRIE